MVNGGNEIRKFAINQIYELNLHHRFASMLIDYNYSNENNPNELFDEIKKMGKLKDESILDKEEKKNWKKCPYWYNQKNKNINEWN